MCLSAVWGLVWDVSTHLVACSYSSTYYLPWQPGLGSIPFQFSYTEIPMLFPNPVFHIAFQLENLKCEFQFTSRIDWIEMELTSSLFDNTVEGTVNSAR
jgi:hypothetical protein